MRFVLERVSEPEIEPVTLTEAKRHIRQYASVTAEDADVTSLISLAREWVEDYTGRIMVDQTWKQTVFQTDRSALVSGDRVGGYSRPGYSGSFRWSDNSLLLKRSPVLGIVSVKVIDLAGAETVVDPDSYVLRESDSKYPRLIAVSGTSWTTEDFVVEFRAGFADRDSSPQTGAEVVPATLKHAIKLILANFDQNRDLVNIGNIVTELPLGLKWLLASQKADSGFA